MRIALTALAFAISAPAFAQTMAPPAPTPTPAGKASPMSDADKPICKREQTETRLPGKKVCHTKAEWDQIKKDSRPDPTN